MATYKRVAEGPGGATHTNPKFAGSPQFKILPITVDFDPSYPTGGETIDTEITADFRDLKGGFFESKAGYVFRLDAANKKVMAYRGDNDAASDGPLVEVAAGVDLSAVTGVFGVLIGY